jgi:hypothetical protein
MMHPTKIRKSRNSKINIFIKEAKRNLGQVSWGRKVQT